MAALLTLSATDVAIVAAVRSGTFRRIVREGRLGAFVSFEDARGVIEVHLSDADADARLQALGVGL